MFVARCGRGGQNDPEFPGWIAHVIGVVTGHGLDRRWVGECRYGSVNEYVDPEPGLYEICDWNNREFALIRFNGSCEIVTRYQAGLLAWAIHDGLDLATTLTDSRGRVVIESRGQNARVINWDGSEGWTFVSTQCAKLMKGVD